MAAHGHLMGQSDSGLSHSGIDEISVIHFPEMKKLRKINFIRQNHVINPLEINIIVFYNYKCTVKMKEFL
jgi:hypothetical protein